MKVENASITILFEYGGLKVRLHDEKAGIEILEAALTPDNVCKALSRLAHTPCKLTVADNLHLRLGKKLVVGKFEFTLPANTSFSDRKTVAREIAAKDCPGGWEPDLGFNRQSSFFTKDGKTWARDTIRKWVDNNDDD